jgi:hypothetical protein
MIVAACLIRERYYRQRLLYKKTEMAQEQFSGQTWIAVLAFQIDATSAKRLFLYFFFPFGNLSAL